MSVNIFQSRLKALLQQHKLLITGVLLYILNVIQVEAVSVGDCLERNQRN